MPTHGKTKHSGKKYKRKNLSINGSCYEVGWNMPMTATATTTTTNQIFFTNETMWHMVTYGWCLKIRAQ